MKTNSYLSFLFIAALTSILSACGPNAEHQQVAAEAERLISHSRYAKSYPELVFRTYQETHTAAVELQNTVDSFISAPSEATLSTARKAWLESRIPYGKTEAFRFYEGPIDFANPATGEEGPEARLNAWPLNEAYIDYVEGNPNAGIINQSDISINPDTLAKKNATDDEADVTTGYHAIEFLLWGQDLSLDGPGARPVSDYQGDTEAVKRRRAYLEAATDLLVRDLAGLVKAWLPGQPDNYRTTFEALPEKEQLSKIMTSLATLAAFELASERISVALMSGDQEDEHSCFSDNTHNDFVYNIEGMIAVWNASGLKDKVAEKNTPLAARLDEELFHCQTGADLIAAPIDRILAGKHPEEKKGLEQLVENLQTVAESLIEAGDLLNVNVQVLAE